MPLITRTRVSLGLGAKRKKGPTVDENGASLQLAEILVGRCGGATLIARCSAGARTLVVVVRCFE